MSTHNICFCGEIRKILCGYPLLTVAMNMSNKNLSTVLLDVWFHTIDIHQLCLCVQFSLVKPRDRTPVLYLFAVGLI